MKKYYLTVLLVMVGIVTLHAQVSLGAKAGMNVNTVKFKERDAEGGSISFNAGVLARIPISEGFYIRPEMLYSVKGQSTPLTGNNGRSDLYLKYITLPVLAGFPLSKNFAFLIGPEFGFMTKATSRTNGNKRDQTDYYQHFDWGLDLGLSYDITDAFGAEVRYLYGFRGLIRGIRTDENGNAIGSDKDGANRVLQIGFYYLFNKQTKKSRP